MSCYTLPCDQAIFTSVRTPMGEGYRIIAASGGLQGNEKQCMTRNSPSHEGLCSKDGLDGSAWPVSGVSFYALPTGRLCVALSCEAGAEHTGRGGQRVYTHMVVFDAGRFADCAFNPFLILRAMIAAGLQEPVLQPPAVLDELALEVEVDSLRKAPPSFHPSLTNGWDAFLIEALFGTRGQIVSIESDWLTTTEALLLGLPGPTRMKASFSAGLRFSTGRQHVLNVLRDDKGVAKARLVGQPVDYVDTTESPKPRECRSAWIDFVLRRWRSGDFERLSRETSRAFSDVSVEGRERIGHLYNDIDAIPEMPVAELLSAALERLQTHGNEVEQNIATEFLAKASRTLVNRFAVAKWQDLEGHWNVLVSKWRSDECAPGFVQPLLEASLGVAMRENALAAAERALALAVDVPATVDLPKHNAILDEVLNRLVSWLPLHPDVDTRYVLRVCDRWADVRPNCHIVDRIRQGCVADASR